MRVRRIERNNNLNAQFETECPAGLYAGLMIIWKGTLGTGDSSLADLGTIDVRFREQNIHHVRAVEYSAYTDLRGGYPEVTNVTDTLFRYSFVIPFRYGPLHVNSGEDNVLNVGDGELYVSVPGVVAGTTYTSSYVDIVWLEDVGAARYVTHATSMLRTYTGQDRVRLGVPNLRHVLIQEPQGVGTYPNSVLITRASRVLVSGDFEQLINQTCHENYIEGGLIGYCMPDFGNANPRTWTGGKYFLELVGANAGDTSYVVQWGAQFVSTTEYRRTVIIGQAMLAENTEASYSTPSTDIAPVDPTSVVAQSQSQAATARPPAVSVPAPRGNLASVPVEQITA